MFKDFRGLALTLSIIVLAVTPIYYSQSPNNGQKASKISISIELGSTKDDVIKALGNPDSPETQDYYYSKGDGELVICFNDKTDTVETIIVRGNYSKYSVNDVMIGDGTNKVKKTFGAPEKLKKYKKSRVECWLYPSRNLYFSFKNGKVDSFGISSVAVRK